MTRALWVVLLIGAQAFAQQPPTGDNMTGKKELSMALCPSAVPGARTTVIDTPDGVELSVGAKGEEARADIRRRARRQDEISRLAERGSMEHTGLGTGSGRYGHCPGMVEDTLVDAVDTPEGTRVVVHAHDARAVAALQASTRERLKVLNDETKPLPRRSKHVPQK
jgi:hypothetical protein